MKWLQNLRMKAKLISAPPTRVGGVDGNFFVGIGVTESSLVGILKLDEVLLHD